MPAAAYVSFSTLSEEWTIRAYSNGTPIPLTAEGLHGSAFSPLRNGGDPTPALREAQRILTASGYSVQGSWAEGPVPGAGEYRATLNPYQHVVTTRGAVISPSNLVYARARGNQLPTDGDAAAIASWYQTPKGHGLTFAQLAQGSDVSPTALQLAITREALAPNPNSYAAKDMALLETWLDNAQRHPSEQELRTALTPAPRQARAAQRLARGRTGI